MLSNLDILFDIARRFVVRSYDCYGYEITIYSGGYMPKLYTVRKLFWIFILVSLPNILRGWGITDQKKIKISLYNYDIEKRLRNFG